MERKILDFSWKQQRLRSCQSFVSPIPVILGFLIVGCIFVPIGVMILLTNNSLVDYEFRYDDICPFNDTSPCRINFNLTDNIPGPVYIYYKLENYYQNHRRYLSSRYNAQ